MNTNKILMSIDQICVIKGYLSNINKEINKNNPKKNSGKYNMAPGIINFGNTCFHNAAAQLFYRVEELTSFLVHKNVMAQYKNDSYIKHFITLLKEMKNASDNINNNVITNQSLVVTQICPILGPLKLSTSGNYVSGYSAGVQADAGELLGLLLDSLTIYCTNTGNIELNVKKKNICKDQNGKQIPTKKFPENDPRTFFRNTIETHYCPLSVVLPYDEVFYKKGTMNKSGKIRTKDEFSDDLADNYLRTTAKIEFKNAIKLCNKWKLTESKNNNMYHIIITNENKDKTLEKILSIHKKINDVMTVYKKKGNNNYYPHIKIENVIPGKYMFVFLSIFATGNKIHHQIGLSDSNNELKINYIKNNAELTKTYILLGVVIHHGGTINSGHYTCFINHDGKWYDYNDSSRNPTTFNSSSAFIVLYREKEKKLFDTIDPETIPKDLIGPNGYLQDV